MTKTRAPSTRQLVALLRQRIGRQPSFKALSGLSPDEALHLYYALCKAARAMGIRY